MLNISQAKEIIIAVVSNPSFFLQSAQPDVKIKQVHDLIEEVSKNIG